MMTKITRLFLLTLLIAVTHANAQSPNPQPQKSATPLSPEQQLLQQVNQNSVDYLLKKDYSKLENAFLPDATVISSDGRELNPKAFLEELSSGKREYDLYEIQEPKIAVYGSTAIVSGRGAASGTMNAQPFRGSFRYTKVYIKRANAWKIAYWSSAAG